MATETAAPAIETDRLSKRYGAIHAVEELTVSVPGGVIAGFVGPNGSGKTTTIRMLLGQVAPTGGTARLLGVPVQHPRQVLPRVGALIEGPTFYPGLSGRANLQVLASLGGIDRKRVGEMLELVGLGDRGRDRVKGYSLGMRQRLGVAAALLPDPEMLVLDEPANGLDPEGIIEMRALLRRLRDEGKTVFISSHLLGELEQIADWLVVIHNGRQLYAGPAQEMLAAKGAVLVVAPEKPADLEKVARIAAESGHAPEVRDGHVRISGDGAVAADLNRRCMEAGITLVEIHSQQATLEESFLHMIGGEG